MSEATPVRRSGGTQRQWSAIWYRVRQVFQGLWPWLSADETAEAARWLSPEALRLWQGQSVRDRRHSLRVLRTLQAWGYTHPALMQAALLHDVGKSLARLHLWHRVVWVLVNALIPTWQTKLAQPQGWRYSFWVLANHPELGASLAARAGCDPDVVWLIAHHQAREVSARGPRGEWLACLQAADTLN